MKLFVCFHNTGAGLRNMEQIKTHHLSGISTTAWGKEKKSYTAHANGFSNKVPGEVPIKTFYALL